MEQEIPQMQPQQPQLKTKIHWLQALLILGIPTILIIFFNMPGFSFYKLFLLLVAMSAAVLLSTERV